METNRSVELKVGLFVLIGLGLLFAAIFALGEEDSMFERTYTLHTSFADVGGLRDGATVQVAGMNAGLVRNIRFSDDPSNPELQVDLELAVRFQERIRKDSLATVATQGVLGDRYINVTVGSPSQPVLGDGDWIERKPGGDLMGSLQGIADQIGGALSSEDGQVAGKSLVEILVSIRNVLREVEEGKGLIHHLVYEEGPSQKVDAVLASVEGTVRSLERAIAAVERGDGTAHALIYGSDGKELLARLNSASGRLDGLLEDVKDQKGLMHALIYEDPKAGTLIANLDAASRDLRDVVAAVKKGEGTIGGLVADPTIYEDLKTLIGRAERNKLLKAFIRANISANERSEGIGASSGVGR